MWRNLSGQPAPFWRFPTNRKVSLSLQCELGFFQCRWAHTFQTAVHCCEEPGPALSTWRSQLSHRGRSGPLLWHLSTEGGQKSHLLTTQAGSPGAGCAGATHTFTCCFHLWKNCVLLEGQSAAGLLQDSQKAGGPELSSAHRDQAEACRSTKGLIPLQWLFQNRQ